MPGQDKTGPLGQGPMTGRGLGQGLARGRGRGFRRGFGLRQAFMQPQVITETQEKELLKQELEAIKSEQVEIESRLKEIK